MRWGDHYGFREYVPVGQRKAQARSFAEKKAKKQGRKPEPVEINGNKIAKTFWGKAWCDHLESYSDYANRLPRGRTYARNGSVADLLISAGKIEAIVGGSDVYEIKISITKLKANQWKQIRNDCSASIDSLLDLLSGKFSDGVMQRLTDRKEGLFPAPREIRMNCNCPDGAGLCKHLAAVLYGVGARLDKSPELLFLLRDVEHTELVSAAVSRENLSAAFGDPSSDLAGEDLSAMFGIELDTTDAPTEKKKSRAAATKKTIEKGATKNVGKKATAKKKSPKKSPKKAAPKQAVAKKKSATKPANKKKSAASKKKAVKKK
jgi:uncharacterized Zn finger protein